VEPAAFIFPLPEHLKEHYARWARSLRQSTGEKTTGENDEGYAPVFVPVYPAYPGFMPYPFPSSGSPSGICPCCGKKTTSFWPPGVNPFILFLILILLLLGTRKDQILSAIRKLLLKTDQKPEEIH